MNSANLSLRKVKGSIGVAALSGGTGFVSTVNISIQAVWPPKVNDESPPQHYSPILSRPQCPSSSVGFQCHSQNIDCIYSPHHPLESAGNHSLFIQGPLICFLAASSTGILMTAKWRPSWNLFLSSKWTTPLGGKIKKYVYTYIHLSYHFGSQIKRS